MNDTPTPRVDAAIRQSDGQWSYVLANLARDLERQLAEATAWRKIETAPQTGERILAWDHGDVIVVHWEDCSGVSSLTPRMGWATRYDHEYMCYDEEHPTHWQPLPNPPTV